jgi:hypothetical protein
MLPIPFLSKLLHKFNREKKFLKIIGYSCNFQKTPKVNNDLMGEKSLNLVTLYVEFRVHTKVAFIYYWMALLQSTNTATRWIIYTQGFHSARVMRFLFDLTSITFSTDSEILYVCTFIHV